MSDLKIQGVVEMSSEGAEQALNRVADKAGQMASRLEREADKAGKAVDGLGAGATENAEQFSRAEGKIVASIKRTTQSLEQLGKSASQKIELRIADRGLDASKFEPALVKLRELEAAQLRVAGSSGRFGGSMQNTSYQLQDFIVQVNGGTAATQALGQQLPQLLGSFGAAGAAFGVVAALLPNMVNLFFSSAEGSKKLSDTMSDLDKAIGEVGGTVKQFDMEGLYEEFNKASGAARGAIIEQLNFQQAFIETSRLVASKKFGESIGGLGSYGTLDKMAGAFGSSGAESLAKQLGIGTEKAKDLLPILAGLKAGTEDVNLAFNRFGTMLLSGNKEARDLASTMAGLSKSERDAASASTSITEAQAKMAAGHVLTKKEADAAAKSTKDLGKENEALAALLATINSKDSGLDSNYVKNVETLLEAYGRGKLSLAEFNDVFARYVAMQPAAVAAAKETAKAQEDYAKALSAALDPLEKQARSLEEQVATYGLTESAIQTTLVARLEEARIIAESNGAWDEHLSYLDKEIELRKRIAGAASQKEYLDANKRAAQAAGKEWEKVSDDVNRALTDALMRGFENGKSFGQNFADSLKASLKTLVIRLVVNMVGSTTSGLVSSVADAVMGTSFSSSSGGGSGGSSGSNWLGSASNLSSAYSLYNNAGLAYSWASGSMSTANALGTYYANATGTGLDGLLATNGAYGTSAGATSGASSSTISASTVGWVAAIVMGMYMSSQAWKQGIRWDDNYVNASDPKTMDAAALYRTSHDKTAKAIFGNAATDFMDSEFWAVMSGSSLSAQVRKAWFGGDLTTGTPTFKGNFSEAGFTNGQSGVEVTKHGGFFTDSKRWWDWQPISAELDKSLDIMYITIRDTLMSVGEMFQDTTLIDKIKGFSISVNTPGNSGTMATIAEQLAGAMGSRLFPSISSLRKSGEVWSATFSRIVKESGAVSNVLDVMGETLVSAFGSGNADKVLRLSGNFVKLFGSVDQMNTSFGAYYANFYTQAEQSTRAWENMGRQFMLLDQVMPTTRAEFRALVDSLDLSTDAGQKMFGALMTLQAPFAQLTATMEDAAYAATAMAVASKEMQAAQIGNFYAYQRKTAEDTLKGQISAAGESASSATVLIETFRSLSDSLGTYRASLISGADTAASPFARYDEAKARYSSTAVLAQLGNADAAGQLQSVADDFLSASRDISTASNYARDVAGVIGAVDSVIGVAGRQIPIAENQLQVAQDQLSTLQGILDAMTGNQVPVVVDNYQQAATDWAKFFAETAVGASIQTAAGTMQRISESMGLLIDTAGKGYTFSQSDNPYTLAGSSDEYRQYLLAKYGQWSGPSFASGGLHRGGMRLVGENGPELEFTGPSRIFNAGDTSDLLGSGLSSAVAALTREVAELRAEQRAGQYAIASNTAKSARLLDKFDIDGMPEVRAA